MVAVSVNSFLSLFVVLAMLFTGAAESPDPDALHSRVLSVSDIVVTLDGEDYPLDLSAQIGMQTEDGTALIDFSVPTSDGVLFPVQAQFDAEGISLKLGEGSVYRFTQDLLMDSMGEIDAEASSFLDLYMDSYTNLMDAGMRLGAMSETDIAAYDEALTKILIDVAGLPATEETTLTLDGESYPAYRITYTLENDVLMQFADQMAALDPSGFFGAYFDYLGMTYYLTGIEAPDTPSEFFALADASMAMKLDFIYTEDGKIQGDMVVSVQMAGVGTLSVPIHFTQTDSETVFGTFSVDDAASGTVFVGDFNYTENTLEMNIADVVNIGMNLHISASYADDGSNATYLCMAIDELFILETNEFIDTQGNSYADFSLASEDDGLSFSMTLENAAIENHIAGVEPVIISTEEDMENSTGLLFSLMGLMGDIEKLMTNESIVALTEATTAIEEAALGIIGGADGPTSIIISTESEVIDVVDISDEPTFPMPQITWIPEGFYIEEPGPDTYNYGDGTSYVAYYLINDDWDYVELYFTDAAGLTEEYIIENGELVKVDPQSNSNSSITRRYDSTYQSFEYRVDDVGIIISDYYNVLSLEDVANIITGITFATAE